MLQSLYIQNYALIDKLDIEFQDGFTVITGETGAGKSILLGAIGLLLGNRADTTVLNDPEKKCQVEGVFQINNLGLESFFSENDLDYEQFVILRREIVPSGKSRAFINDTPVNLTILKELGDQLVDIHSQHETLMLNKSSFQLNTLDDFAGLSLQLTEYKKTYFLFLNLSKNLHSLVQQNELAKQEEDYFIFQFNELEAAFLSENEEEQLKEREKYLTHIEEINIVLENAKRLLSGEEQPVLDNLLETRDSLKKIAPYLPGADQLVERLHSLGIELKDIINEINRIDCQSEFEPGEMQKVTDRLNLLYGLQQKHHVNSISELIEVKKSYESKLKNIVYLDEKISALKSELSLVTDRLENSANVLHEERKKKALTFSVAVIDLLKQMGIKEADFRVEIEEISDFNENGKSKVSFLFSANKGNVPGEISKIASGGELSRLMLAIKSLITKEHIFPTVIFDEIDSGVSGDIAAKVGKVMQLMAQHHQLIAISHLPQIASKANHQKHVFKLTENGFSRTRIETLSHENRIHEIAKMLSNENVSESAINAAKELFEI